MRIKVTADSTCDLPKELLAEHDITLTPLIVIKNDEEFYDEEDEDEEPDEDDLAELDLELSVADVLYHST